MGSARQVLLEGGRNECQRWRRHRQDTMTVILVRASLMSGGLLLE